MRVLMCEFNRHNGNWFISRFTRRVINGGTLFFEIEFLMYCERWGFQPRYYEINTWFMGFIDRAPNSIRQPLEKRKNACHKFDESAEFFSNRDDTAAALIVQWIPRVISFWDKVFGLAFFKALYWLTCAHKLISSSSSVLTPAFGVITGPLAP